MPSPYSIEIFVPQGDPEGLRILSLKNWTGIGLVFPRAQWRETRNRPEFERTGVYILHGYDEDPDIPMAIYQRKMYIDLNLLLRSTSNCTF